MPIVYVQDLSFPVWCRCDHPAITNCLFAHDIRHLARKFGCRPSLRLAHTLQKLLYYFTTTNQYITHPCIETININVFLLIGNQVRVSSPNQEYYFTLTSMTTSSSFSSKHFHEICETISIYWTWATRRNTISCSICSRNLVEHFLLLMRFH